MLVLRDASHGKAPPCGEEQTYSEAPSPIPKFNPNWEVMTSSFVMQELAEADKSKIIT